MLLNNPAPASQTSHRKLQPPSCRLPLKLLIADCNPLPVLPLIPVLLSSSPPPLPLPLILCPLMPSFPPALVGICRSTFALPSDHAAVTSSGLPNRTVPGVVPSRCHRPRRPNCRPPPGLRLPTNAARRRPSDAARGARGLGTRPGGTGPRAPAAELRGPGGPGYRRTAGTRLDLERGLTGKSAGLRRPAAGSRGVRPPPARELRKESDSGTEGAAREKTLPGPDKTAGREACPAHSRPRGGGCDSACDRPLRHWCRTVG
eukprot:765525-Hanusia_phi.AAC.9